jgi:hypothetical protein
LEQALYSLENQSVDKNSFEVLIISNIQLKFPKIHNMNLRIILSDRESLAGKLAEGILLARNEIIVFLEDDDLYCQDRIKHILTVFGDNEDLDYYHNKSVHFRTLTFPRSGLKFCSKKKFRILLKHKDMENGDITASVEYKFNKYQADYNLSSIALRKDFIADYVEILLKLGTRYVDSFFFSLALYKGNSIIIDSNIDTLIRTHSLNASQSVESVEEKKNNKRYSIDMEKLTVVLINIGIIEKRFVQHFIISRGLDDLMKVGNISRVEVFSKMLKLLKIYRRYFFKSDVTLKALMYIISPNVMYKLLGRFHNI